MKTYVNCDEIINWSKLKTITKEEFQQWAVICNMNFEANV